MADVRVLLDVDGVLNALDPSGHAWPEWHMGIGRMWEGSLRLTWSTAVAEFVRDLHEGGVEVMWLTMWGDAANGDVAELLGPPQFPVAGTCFDDGHDPELWWKLQVSARLYETDHKPFVWIDDELRRRPEVLAWASTLPFGDWLLVSPQAVEGLTPYHLEAIAEFVAAHTSVSSEGVA